MGKYDFTSLPNRIGHHTYKWKEAETDSEVLPAWIADMDFVVLPEIRQAVQTYADQLVYGYTYASEELIKEVQKWEATQHGYHFDKEALVFIEGVVPAISTAIQAFTKEGEAVLINTPVYPPFARSVKLNNRRLITNSLVERMVCLRLTLINWRRIWWRKRSNSIFFATLTILVDVFGKKKSWRRLANSVKNTVFSWFRMRFTKIWPSLVTSIIPSIPSILPSKNLLSS